VPILIEGLRDADGEIREAACGCLALATRESDEWTDAEIRRAFDPAVPILVALLNDPGISVRALAIRALKHLRYAGSELDDALEDYAIEVRIEAAEDVRGSALCALGQIELTEFEMRQVLKLFEGGDSEIRAQAAQALGRLGPAATADDIRQLSEMLHDPAAWVRLQAAEALGCVGVVNAETLKILVNALKNPSEALRLCAAHALGSIGPPASAAMNELMQSLRDDDNDLVSFEAAVALVKITNKIDNVSAFLKQACCDRDPVGRWKAFKTVGKLGRLAHPPVRALRELIETEVDPWVWKEARKALRCIENDSPCDAKG
jgi:hypothetical protein